jgi:host factor-I protein
MLTDIGGMGGLQDLIGGLGKGGFPGGPPGGFGGQGGFPSGPPGSFGGKGGFDGPGGPGGFGGNGELRGV